MEYRELGRTGLRLSALGFGASSLGGVFHSLREEDGIQAVFTAIACGINFIDVSPYYGYYKAEQVLGKALRQIPRAKYILSTKVGRYGQNGVNSWDYTAQRARESVYESMERLGVDHIDLINVHDIEFADLTQICEETLPALVALREEGVVGHVGITDLQGACRRAADHCAAAGYPIERLALEYAVQEPRITSTLFSTTRSANVRANVGFASGQPDGELLQEVRGILGEDFRKSWKNT